VLVLTDLTDWGLDPLDSLAGAARVKLRLTAGDRQAIAFLRGLLPTASEPRLARVAARRADHGWRALAVVERAAESQYDALLAAARRIGDVPAPVAALALAGDGVHGNRGRPWHAERGNLHLSCAIPVDLDAATTAAAVSAVPAVAVLDALAACAPGRVPRLKWVNDVLVDGAKLAGVLAAAQSRGPRLRTIVCGIGINVEGAPPVAPTLFVPRVTCLRAHPAGRAVRLGDLCRDLLVALWRRVRELHDAGPAPVKAAYRAHCGDVGRVVTVWPEGSPDLGRSDAMPPPLAHGRVLGLDDDLALRIEGAAAPLVNGRLAHDESSAGAAATGEPAPAASV